MKRLNIITSVLIILGLVGLFTVTNYLRLISLIMISVGLIILVKFNIGQSPTPATKPTQPEYTDYTDPLT